MIQFCARFWFHLTELQLKLTFLLPKVGKLQIVRHSLKKCNAIAKRYNYGGLFADVCSNMDITKQYRKLWWATVFFVYLEILEIPEHQFEKYHKLFHEPP